MAIFPGAVITDSDLLVGANFKTALLSDNPLSAVAVTVNVNSTSGFPTIGAILIDNELIKYTGLTGTSFTGCTRAFDSTSATTHVQNSQVRLVITAFHVNSRGDEIKAIEQFISDLVGRDNTRLKLPDGSNASPSASFAADLDTGMFRFGSDEIGWAVGGSTRLRLGAGNLRVAFDIVPDATASLRNIGNVTDYFDHILMGNGSQANPAFSYGGDSDTGTFRPGANRLGFVTGGSEHWEVTSAGDFSAFGSTERLIINDGTVGSPGLQFTGDGDTGLRRAGSNDIIIVTGGTDAVEISTTKMISAVLFLGPDGSVSAPSHSFGSDQDTGSYRIAADTYGIATAGTEALRIDSTQRIGIRGTPTEILHIFGTAASTNYYLKLDATQTSGQGGFYNTANISGSQAGLSNIQFGSGINPSTIAGISQVSMARLRADSSVSSLYMGTGGSSSIYFGTNDTLAIQINTSQRVLFTDGAVGTPSMSFINDTDNGSYRIGADNWALSVGGAETLQFQTGLTVVSKRLQPAADNTLDFGTAARRWSVVYAATGTINTSHSSTKANIVDIDPEEFEVPQGVFFDRDGRRHMGYLNDCLPDVARPMDEGKLVKTMNYENAVIGVLCAAVRKLQKELKELKSK